MKMIFVTGSNSALAKQIVSKIDRKSFKITLSQRHNVDDVTGDCYTIVEQDLASSFSDKFIEQIRKTDIILHVAWLRPQSSRTAITQNLHLIRRFTDINPNMKIIFISSYKASSQSKSQYLKAKYECEKYIKTCRDHLIWKVPYVMSNTGVGPDRLVRKLREQLPCCIQLWPNLQLKSVDFENLTSQIATRIDSYGVQHVGDFSQGGVNGLLWANNKPRILMPVVILMTLLQVSAYFFPTTPVFDRLLTFLDIKHNE